MVLINTATFETYQIPAINSIKNYFWTPDGKAIGVVTDNNELILSDIQSGQVNIVTAEEYLSVINPNAPMALVAQVSNEIPEKLILNSQWGESRRNLSYDKRHKLLREESNDLNIFVKDLETEELIPITSIENGWRPWVAEWSPVDQTLAIIFSDTALEMGGFTEIPNFKMRILDIHGNFVAQYKNIPFINFSPDGTKFLYRPLEKNASNSGIPHLAFSID